MASDPQEITIRFLGEADLPAAYAVLRQLRTHLSAELFRERLARQQAAHRYELLGAFAGEELVGVLGLRPVETMARGPHLHIDDLVVAETVRRRGIGQLLLAHAEQLARQRGLGAVFLDSRPEALDFYTRQGYRPHTAPLVRKQL
jgi:GNAT superfamily N-acetyltransferase